MQRTFATTARWLALAAFVFAVTMPALAQRNVTLRLNTATLPDTVKTDIDRNIQVRGCLDGCSDDQSALPDGSIIAWNDNTTLTPGNQGGDFWEASFQIPDNETLNFKFYADQSEMAGIGGWEDGGNHQIEAGTGDVSLDLHFFEKGDDQPYDWRPFTVGADQVGVWFRVFIDTEQAITKGLDIDDAGLQVGVRGNPDVGGFQGEETNIMDWGATNIVLTPEAESGPGAGLYSGLVTYPASAAGTQQAYKFFFSDTDTPDGWEDISGGGDRVFTVPSSDTTLYWQFYGDSPANTGNTVEATVDFLVDVQPLVDVGLVSLARGDAIQVRGAFNGWDCPDDNQDDCGLFQIPGSLDFGNSVPITAAPADQINYKYYVVFNVDEDMDGELDDPEWANIGWEEPLDNGGGNRIFDFAGSAQTLDTQFFNGIRRPNVIPAGDPIPVTFSVDMTTARGFATDPFDPTTDKVTIQLEDAVWRVTQGFAPGLPTDGLLTEGFEMTDPDGDGIFTGVFNVQAPTYNGIGYRYAYGNDTDGYVVEGRGGFDTGRRRYRYILPEGGVPPASFEFALDGFRPIDPDDPASQMPMEANPTDPNRDDLIATNPLFFETGFTDPQAVAIEDVGGSLPTTMALATAYPNPFRGSTQIEYSVPQAGPVSLTVYDVTGRVVATLVDEVQAASNYRVGFDASGLAAGVYVYQLRTQEGLVSQRLTVVR
ncbi:MAG: T9SS type A sorting domain-containing protein [Bacteroidota bacterium]